MPQLYMIGGPNGAGKTTTAMNLLPELLKCYEYVNADSIAAALSPFYPETTAMQAGRLMLERIRWLAQQKKDFAFETTMASKTFMGFLTQCKQAGYHINLLFLWLQSPELAVVRVQDRVQNGGHSIPDEVVLRRYKRSMNNFLNIYVPLADEWVLYDNSFNHSIMIAEKELGSSVSVLNKEIWHKFENYTQRNFNCAEYIFMNKSNSSDLLQRIDLGVRRGVARALLEHKKAGCSIAVWKDDKVVWIPPEEIEVDETLIQTKSN